MKTIIKDFDVTGIYFSTKYNIPERQAFQPDLRSAIFWEPDIRIETGKDAKLEYFYIRNGSKTFSRKLYLKIRKSVRLLSKHPFLGIQTDDENIRNLIEGDYTIFYKPDNETIHILSIWDCRQDPESLTLKMIIQL